MAILTTSPDDLKTITAMQENMFAHMLFFPERLSSCTVLKAQELIIIDSHLANSTFNLVCKARLKEENALDAIESAATYFHREDMPFAWWISPDDMPRALPHLLETADLHQTETCIGMALSIEDYAYEQAELRVERVLNTTQMQDYASIMCDVQGETPAIQAWYEQLSLFPFLLDDYEQLYVGYLDEQPVSCGTITLHSEVAGVHGLATIRSQRRRGFATAMLQELLMRSQATGYSTATLQAAKETIILYEKLGFEKLCEFMVFTSKDV